MQQHPAAAAQQHTLRFTLPGFWLTVRPLALTSADRLSNAPSQPKPTALVTLPCSLCPQWFLDQIKADPNLELVGAHCHLGSTITKVGRAGLQPLLP